MTYREALQWSLDCQDAVNLSGVVHSFDKAVSAIWQEGNRLGKGTEYTNTHPAVYLYLDKLASLNRRQCLCSENLNSFSKAHAEVITELNRLEKEQHD